MFHFCLAVVPAPICASITATKVATSIIPAAAGGDTGGSSSSRCIDHNNDYDGDDPLDDIPRDDSNVTAQSHLATLFGGLVIASPVVILSLKWNNVSLSK